MFQCTGNIKEIFLVVTVQANGVGCRGSASRRKGSDPAVGCTHQIGVVFPVPGADVYPFTFQIHLCRDSPNINWMSGHAHSHSLTRAHTHTHTHTHTHKQTNIFEQQQAQ